MATLHKYPKTYHFSFSENLQNDDRMLFSDDIFDNKNIVVTEKLDGENSTLMTDYIHARSLSSADHPSRHRLKALHAQMKYLIPEGWRVCGENMCAFHSIFYNKLESYFYVFSIWNDKNECLSWNDTKEWCELLGLRTVPVLYEGPCDFDKIKQCYSGESKLGGYTPHPTKRLSDIIDTEKEDKLDVGVRDYITYRYLIKNHYDKFNEFSIKSQEGYVCRNVDAFKFEDFTDNMAKWVRRGHVQTTELWMNLSVIPNILSRNKH